VGQKPVRKVYYLPNKLAENSKPINIH